MKINLSDQAFSCSRINGKYFKFNRISSHISIFIKCMVHWPFNYNFKEWPTLQMVNDKECDHWIVIFYIPFCLFLWNILKFFFFIVVINTKLILQIVFYPIEISSSFLAESVNTREKNEIACTVIVNIGNFLSSFCETHKKVVSMNEHRQ